jgi:hypothetical protein
MSWLSAALKSLTHLSNDGSHPVTPAVNGVLAATQNLTAEIDGFALQIVEQAISQYCPGGALVEHLAQPLLESMAAKITEKLTALEAQALAGLVK